jgi:hypothetical protein
MKPGSAVDVPELTGRWTVWSKSGEAPGAHFLVPSDSKARATGVKYAVVRVQTRAGQVKDQVDLLRTDPPLQTLATPGRKTS